MPIAPQRPALNLRTRRRRFSVCVTGQKFLRNLRDLGCEFAAGARARFLGEIESAPPLAPAMRCDGCFRSNLLTSTGGVAVPLGQRPRLLYACVQAALNSLPAGALTVHRN